MLAKGNAAKASSKKKKEGRICRAKPTTWKSEPGGKASGVKRRASATSSNLKTEPPSRPSTTTTTTTTANKAKAPGKKRAKKAPKRDASPPAARTQAQGAEDADKDTIAPQGPSSIGPFARSQSAEGDEQELEYDDALRQGLTAFAPSQSPPEEPWLVNKVDDLTPPHSPRDVPATPSRSSETWNPFEMDNDELLPLRGTSREDWDIDTDYLDFGAELLQ